MSLVGLTWYRIRLEFIKARIPLTLKSTFCDWAGKRADARPFPSSSLPLRGGNSFWSSSSCSAETALDDPPISLSLLAFLFGETLRRRENVRLGNEVVRNVRDAP